MGKKDKKKKEEKKGKGIEKTAEKTEKKAKLKAKKELAAKGEDDIESMVKAIEEEERKRQEVKEVVVGPPSHRSNFSMTAHSDNPEIVFFGGEFYNGQKTTMFNDLLVFNLKRSEWTQIKSPAGPPPRSSHQACIVSQAGGQLWVFGGEFTSPSESQFYHYKDLWVFHFASKRWEKVTATGGPSARSGHRMVVFKKYLIVFGGFHDNLRDCKYFNDLYSFDLEERKWAKLVTVGSEPSPRSACQMFSAEDGRVVVYGGYCKEKVKKVEKGVTHIDMFLLSPDKHDDTGIKWRWQTVKQVGERPTMRTGLCNAVGRDGKVFMFGGVMDKQSEEDEEESEEDSDDEDGNFFNEMYSVNVEGERATWHLVNLTGRKEIGEKGEKGEKKRRRKEKGDGEAMEDDNVDQLEDLALEDAGPTTVTVESGAFTVSSTVGEAEKGAKGDTLAELKEKDCLVPSARFGSQMVFKGGSLYLFGGIIESGEKDITLKDFYSLDTNKIDSWNVIIESDQVMEWLGETDDDDDDDDEEGDDEDEDDESGMDTD
eukprot:GFUD01120303.1.p1 GENE.GFUD01120303.1~~GFUD01120303.1.p1  ORF type:complete len:540 (+),score=191.37 GFUD01120303.1:92-1711(+)